MDLLGSRDAGSPCGIRTAGTHSVSLSLRPRLRLVLPPLSIRSFAAWRDFYPKEKEAA